MAPPSRRERLHGRHPTQKPLRLVRRALVACTREGELVFDPFCGSGTTAVAAKELGRFFVGAELEREFCALAARRIGAAERGGILDALHGAAGRDLDERHQVADGAGEGGGVVPGPPPAQEPSKLFGGKRSFFQQRTSGGDELPDVHPL